MIAPVTSTPVITIDGPSGVGKGAISAALADTLGWHLLDSGAVYRAVALVASERGIDPTDERQLVAVCEGMDLQFQSSDSGIAVLIDGAAVEERLRTEQVSQMASKVAAIPSVRRALLDLQYSFRQPPGLIADGRDMGTVVFPDAVAKIFLTASAHERATRRFKQLKEKGEDVIFDRLLSDIDERDRRDRERTVSPTVPAADAKVIDSTDMNLNQVIVQATAYVESRLGMIGKSE
ncbi:MAG TPA: (d)CMP kinase [Wenzhouxiangella sp.]